ncbi:MAG: lysine exporter LysO family protein [Anaerovoracaceae bacterium]
MTVMPFICLGAGFLISLKNLSKKWLDAADMIVNAALVLLMLTIGMNIGINESVMKNLPVIGLNCCIISLSAIALSIIFVLAAEKTVLPLERLRDKLYCEKIDISSEVDIASEENKKGSPLVWIMPVSIVAGVILGVLVFEEDFGRYLDWSLYGSLVILYTGVGISLGSNRKVFAYIKIMGMRIIFLPLAIFAGSLTAGILTGAVLGIPLYIPVLSASGMSYYSLTGAYLTQAYGIEAGAYGFMVNVMREFFTVLFMPLLIKISKGSPIAGGASGNMDTMLVPVTKFVGAELGLAALITGVILTFFVPFELPALDGIIKILSGMN